MKKFFVIAASLLLSVAAFAQETNKDADGLTQYGPYETNKFFDNWFIDLGAGLNTVALDPDKWGNSGLAIQADLGKWFTPEFGARFGYHGLKNEIKDYEAALTGYNFFKMDGMVNLSNLLGGYKETRFWEFIPFLGFGYLGAKNNDGALNKEFGAEFGLVNNFCLGNRLDLNLEIGDILTREYAFVRGNGGTYINFPYATLGLGLNLGRTNWTRKATTIAAYTAAVAAAEAAAKAAKAAADKALADKAAAEAAQKALQDQLNSLKNRPVEVADYFEEPVIAYFKIGKSVLSATEKEHLKAAAKKILAHGDKVKFTLSGHADPETGSARRNEYLAKERANTVYNLMQELGVPADKFVVTSSVEDVFDTPELCRCVIVEKQ